MKGHASLLEDFPDVGGHVGVQMVSYAAAELIQLATLAIRAGADAKFLSSQLSIHPSHGERLLKIFGHDHHEVCQPA